VISTTGFWVLDKSMSKPITQITVAGNGDMTLPSMTKLLKAYFDPELAIAPPFLLYSFLFSESVAFRCLCQNYMQREKLNKEITSII
jgi:hypothetical protein